MSMGQERFLDWTDVTARRRAAILAACQSLARMLNPRINAFFAYAAAESKQNQDLPLAGLPYVAKDMFERAAREPSFGLAQGQMLRETAGGTAEVLARLDGAGAAYIGATHMSELAYEPSGQNATYGRARNPWSLAHITGGSSSGSAAAIAAGAAFVALGSDTAGSIRIPAHCCGVTGLKPTLGAIPSTGGFVLAPSLDTIGLMARSAADLLPVFRCLTDQPECEPAITRLIVFADILRESETPIRDACSEAIMALRAIGPEVEERAGNPILARCDPLVLAILQAEAARTLRPFLASSKLHPVLRRRIAKGHDVDPAVYRLALDARAELIREFLDEVLGPGTIIALPVMRLGTPTAEKTDPADPAFTARKLYELSALTRFVNYLGLPALSVPAGFDDRGLPMGLQLVGRPGADIELIGLATRLQAMTSWHGRIPTAAGDLIMGGKSALTRPRASDAGKSSLSTMEYPPENP